MPQDESFNRPIMPPPYPMRGRVTDVFAKDHTDNPNGHKTLYTGVFEREGMGSFFFAPLSGLLGTGYNLNATSIDGGEIPLPIDTEVVVTFIDGDWQCPLITDILPQDSNVVSHVVADRAGGRGPINFEWAGSTLHINATPNAGAIEITIVTDQHISLTTQGTGDINLDPLGTGKVMVSGGGDAVALDGDSVTMSGATGPDIGGTPLTISLLGHTHSVVGTSSGAVVASSTKIEAT